MIIVRIQGGLGNQLFQYALYESFRNIGREVKADVTGYLEGREERELELGKLGIEMDLANRNELHRYYADNSVWTDRILRYTLGRKRYIKEKSCEFNPQIFNLYNGYLNGYWQSEKYFQEVANKIRRNIIFQNINTPEIMSMETKMERNESVSVHIRIGDYLQNLEMYGNICTPEYYRKAFEYMQEKVKNPVFYVFSDEPEKAEEILNGYNYCMVTENRGENSYKDMYLMSRCRHHIIANSTFSWWGAWLDEKTNQIVLTPTKWNNFCIGSDICCIGWRAIS